ncbi:DEAD box ATP-dependent RNA helicase family member protein [Theileria equi strain WA]|uniref:ATP-dependent RNA helicase n=1 Tax=Theileria equi strain WA TaxID=1537102 RepID=L1LF45_THEEQ|nr:DEAD box ATP-dependent RNA helicase family member protein [Theileria equi strain WA]EKX74062.1 DEAD box ATP-dependent RNA helicase family member protein [Theileria equi strain WA]|eukprot:XP_004833514.1 DEAD box ATP-dependent RNA helicase family member protein [Theileria equi strain WA]
MDISVLDDRLLSNLKKIGISEPTEIQSKTLQTILDKNSKKVLFTSETGSGKTLAYLLPLLQLISEHGTYDVNPKAIIVVPSVLLAYQIYDILLELTRGLNITFNVSDGIETGPIVEIAISTPEKLVTKLETYNLNYRLNVFENIRYAVFDDVDALVMPNQKSYVEKLLKLTRGRIKTIICSSTISTAGTKSHAAIINKLFKIHTHIKSQKWHTIPENITTEFIHCQENNDKLEKLSEILSKMKDERTLIFCNKSSTTLELAEKVKTMVKKCKIDVINKKVNLIDQLEILRSKNKRHIIIATDIISRGIDIANVTTVVHYDFPPNALIYLHRSGRTGKGGLQGRSVALWTDKEETFYNLLHENKDRLPELFSMSRGPMKQIKRQRKLDNRETEQQTDP